MTWLFQPFRNRSGDGLQPPPQLVLKLLAGDVHLIGNLYTKENGLSNIGLRVMRKKIEGGNLLYEGTGAYELLGMFSGQIYDDDLFKTTNPDEIVKISLFRALLTTSSFVI